MKQIVQPKYSSSFSSDGALFIALVGASIINIFYMGIGIIIALFMVAIYLKNYE